MHTMFILIEEVMEYGYNMIVHRPVAIIFPRHNTKVAGTSGSPDTRKRGCHFPFNTSLARFWQKSNTEVVGRNNALSRSGGENQNEIRWTQKYSPEIFKKAHRHTRDPLGQ